ncbi:MAG: ribosome maturation factor RimM [Clostridiales Family XIII bacterium]|nr:ribosome maturation factor RimM [Clostridiales Family XIII bacterium]
MSKLIIAKITSPLGLKGEVSFFYYSKEKHLKDIKKIYIDETEYGIESIRYKRENPIVKLKGIDNRNDAESLKNKIVYIEESELPELNEDEYYDKDLIGCNVIFENQIEEGVLADILHYYPNDIFEIKINNKKILIPFRKKFIKEINIEKKKIVIIVGDDYLK